MSLPHGVAPVKPFGRIFDRYWPRVWRAAYATGPERRAVIALHYWLDYTTPEIAEVLGVPLGTVNSRLARALRDLRLQLEAQRNV